MTAKLVFLYDSTVELFRDFDLQTAKDLLAKVQAAGTLCELIDTKEVTEAEMERWRERAQVIAVYQKVGVRQSFGSRRGGGLPYLGKQVPALFVFEEGKPEPVSVYPHEKRGKGCSIAAYLESLLKS